MALSTSDIDEALISDLFNTEVNSAKGVLASLCRQSPQGLDSLANTVGATVEEMDTLTQAMARVGMVTVKKLDEDEPVLNLVSLAPTKKRNLLQRVLGF